jgi:hypothetical protein
LFSFSNFNVEMLENFTIQKQIVEDFPKVAQRQKKVGTCGLKTNQAVHRSVTPSLLVSG